MSKTENKGDEHRGTNSSICAHATVVGVTNKSLGHRKRLVSNDKLNIYKVHKGHIRDSPRCAIMRRNSKVSTDK